MLLLPLRRHAQTMGIDAAPLSNTTEVSVDVCAGEKHCHSYISESVSVRAPSKVVLFKSLSTTSQIKIKGKVRASLYSQLMCEGIIIPHLNKTE